MALTIKEKYAKLDFSKMPDDLAVEFKGIKEDTENFDPELVDIEKENFDLLYSTVEKKHPDAIKKGGKLVKTKPATKKKPVAKKKSTTKKPGLKDASDMDILIGRLSNSMDNYDSRKDFAEDLLSQSDWQKDFLHIIWREYWKLDPKDREKSKDDWQWWIADVKNEEPFTPKSRGKKKPEPETNHVEECRKVITEAGYTIKKKPSKSGKKVMKVKVVRQERSIIKDKVEDTFKTISKDISGSEEKDKKYAEMQKAISQLQDLMTKFFNRLNNLAEDNSTEKIEKIIKLIKEVVKD